MKTVYTIGEALIDFVPVSVNLELKTEEKKLPMPQYIQAPGGAPANVAAVISLLGGKSAFIGENALLEVCGHFVFGVVFAVCWCVCFWCILVGVCGLFGFGLCGVLLWCNGAVVSVLAPSLRGRLV